MSDPDAEARWEEIESWLAAAREDRRAVELCLAASPPLLSVAAFHCQQAAEKLLKAFLVQAAVRFRKTHDLEELGAAVMRVFPDTHALVSAVEPWAAWNVAFRYPTDLPTPAPEELHGACAVIDALAERVRSFAPGGAIDSGGSG